MSKTLTKIITDAGADLPEELYEKHNIGVAQLYFHFNDHPKLPQELKGVSFTRRKWLERYDSDYLYELLDRGIGAQTSAPSIQDFDEAYEEAFSQGFDSLLVITLIADSKLTATNDRAITTANNEKYKGKTIEVISSNSATLGLGLIVLRAAERLKQGASFDELVESTKEDAERVNFFVYIHNFEYITRSGRIPAKIISMVEGGVARRIVKPLAERLVQPVATGIAKSINALNLKFILKLNKDSIGLSGRVRSIAQAETKLFNYVSEHLDDKRLNSEIGPAYFIANSCGAIVDFGMHEESANLQERIKRELGVEMPIYEGGTVIGSLAGRVYGVCLI